MKHILISLLFLLPAALFAEKVSEPMAKEVAERFLQQQLPTRSGSVSLQLVYDGMDLNSRTSSNSERPFYIYNNIAGGGFVIVSGDDLVRPILGFATKGKFVVENMPENIVCWLNSMKEQVEWARKHKLVKSKILTKAWKNSTANQIKPVLKYTTAQWDQGWPFNKYAPVINGSKTPSGCVMTATAILMKYHSWPERGEGSLPGYTYKTKERQEVAMPGRVLGEPYNWDIMPMVYDETASPEAQEQIGRLMIDLGTMMEASYEPGGTGAYTGKVPKRLAQYMNYDMNSFELSMDNYSYDQWIEKLKKELHANGPMLYSGNTGCACSGHAFILDGYAENDFFHFNWGWGVNSNGYYLLQSADPGDEKLTLFPLGQSACFGIIPKGQINHNPLNELSTQNIETRATRIELGKPFLVKTFFIYSGVNRGCNFYISVWLTDKDGKPKEQLSEDILVHYKEPFDDYGFNYQEIDKIFCLCKNGFTPGDHIRLFYRSKEDPEWEPASAGEKNVTELTIVSEDGKLLGIEGPLTFDFNRLSEECTIGYPKGTKVEIRENNKNITSQCKVSDTKCQFYLVKKENTYFSVVFYQGKVKKEFYINLP